MGKIINMLTIVTLLHSRRTVTLSEMISACNVSGRSIYRYIGNISQAGIPVYFDDKRKGYALSQQPSRILDNLSVTDISLIVLSLNHIKDFVSNLYKDDCTDLIRRISSRNGYAIENLCGKKILTDDFGSLDISARLIIFAAMYQLRLKVKLKGSEEVTMTLDNVGVKHSGRWLVSANCMGRETIEIPLEDFIHVRIENS